MYFNKIASMALRLTKKWKRSRTSRKKPNSSVSSWSCLAIFKQRRRGKRIGCSVYFIHIIDLGLNFLRSESFEEHETRQGQQGKSTQDISQSGSKKTIHEKERVWGWTCSFPRWSWDGIVWTSKYGRKWKNIKLRRGNGSHNKTCHDHAMTPSLLQV